VRAIVVIDDSEHAKTICEYLAEIEPLYEKVHESELRAYEIEEMRANKDSVRIFVALDVSKHLGIRRVRTYKFLKTLKYGFFDLDMRHNRGMSNEKSGESRFIGFGSCIEPNVELGPLTTICSGAVVKRSAKIGMNAYVGESAHIQAMVTVGFSALIAPATNVSFDVPQGSQVFKEMEACYSQNAESIWQFERLGMDAIYFKQRA
jgi:hypothetical protein